MTIKVALMEGVRGRISNFGIRTARGRQMAKTSQKLEAAWGEWVGALEQSTRLQSTFPCGGGGGGGDVV